MHRLRDDGVSTIEYTERLTFLLFLKMAHERATRLLDPEQIGPKGCSWQFSSTRTATILETTHRHML
jgi:type I restriction enzyme M protein